MKERTRALLAQVDEAHDWDEGRVYSAGGTAYIRTNHCLVCRTERHYYSDVQNGITERYTFTRLGLDVALVEAVHCA